VRKKEFKQFKERSQNPGARSQEVPGWDDPLPKVISKTVISNQ
jgi:hypothetical protein